MSITTTITTLMTMSMTSKSTSTTKYHLALHPPSICRVSVGGFGLLVDGILSAVPLGVLPLSLELGEFSTDGDRSVQLPYQEKGQTRGQDTDNHAYTMENLGTRVR